MSADRDLLEFSAKAFGFVSTKPGLQLEYVRHKNGGFLADPDSCGRVFDPRNNNGDALMLAVNLMLDIQFAIDTVTVLVSCENYTLYGFSELFKDHNGDKEAATRLAILRAAAAIGRQKLEGGAA